MSRSQEIPFHPAADIFPLMEGAAFKALKEDIRVHGQKEPIYLWQGQILDGRNRYRACRQLDKEPRTMDLGEVLPDLDPVAHVLSLNLHRRHLTESQRAMIGARVKALYEADGKARQEASRARPGEKVGRKAGANLPPRSGGKSRDKAAEAVKVSPRSVDHAARVLADGAPGLARMVEEGEVKVSAAAEVAKLPGPEQEEVVAQGADGVKARAREARDDEKTRAVPDQEKVRMLPLFIPEQDLSRFQEKIAALEKRLGTVGVTATILYALDRLLALADEAADIEIPEDLSRPPDLSPADLAALDRANDKVGREEAERQAAARGKGKGKRRAK